MAEVERVRLRWPLVVAVTLLGVVVVGLPFVLSVKDDGFGDWKSLTSSTLTNVGTTFLLAALLFVVERSFVARVTNAAAASAGRVVEEHTRGLAESNEAMRQQLDALQAQVDARSASTEAMDDAVTAYISDDVSFHSVVEALERANDINAVWGGVLTLPACSDLSGPTVSVDWTYRVRPGDSSGYMYPALTLRYETERRSIEVVWQEDESAADAVHKLREAMVADGFGAAARQVDAEYLFRMFQTGIADAIAGRRHQDGSWVVGALGELVGPDIAITQDGLAARGHGLVVASAQFPDPQPAQIARLRGEPIPEQPPADFPVPDGVDAQAWSVALERAAKAHPVNAFRGLGYAPWMTPTSETINSENSPYREVSE